MNLPTVTRAEWAERINARWQTSLTAIFETGRLIAAAKEALDHGEFLGMIESDLPFGARASQMLMKVAADPRLTDAKHASHLPVSWATLHELTKLDDATFEAKIADGTIRPEMERRDIAQVVKRDRREAREAKLAVDIEELPDKRYGVILADPEWRFEPWSRATGMDRSADNHYPTSVTEVIAARPVEKIAAHDCVLFLWATAPMLPHALAVMVAWGFDYKSQAVWDKQGVGTGYWFRNAHELLLIGTRGDPPAPAMGDQFSSIITERARGHSQKPDAAYRIIEAYFPNLPKIELNARDRRDGWDAWGNEIAADRIPAHSTYQAELGCHDSQEYRRTPAGEPIVPHLVKPGDIVTTSYESGPYRVVSVDGPFTGRYPPHWSLSLADVDAKPAKKTGMLNATGWINELVAENGRLLMLFANNDDEVFVEKPAKSDSQAKATEATPAPTRHRPSPPDGVASRPIEGGGSLEQILEHELEAAGPAMAPVDTATSPDIAGEDDRRKVVMAGDFQTQVAPTSADLEIPTFLRRGHPDCFVKAPG